MKKILVVEDDRFLVNVLRLKFEKVGFEVEVAFGGAEAWEKLKAGNFGLVVLDLVMPVEDGFGVLARIRGEKPLAGLPVLVVSNLGQPEDIERAMKLGANGYLVKTSVSIQEIVDQAEKMVEES